MVWIFDIYLDDAPVQIWQQCHREQAWKSTLSTQKGTNWTELTHDEGVDHEVDGGVERIVPQGGETHVGHHCADIDMIDRYFKKSLFILEDLCR